MTTRAGLVSIVQRDLREFPVVTLLGARQVGKTTLAEQVRALWSESQAFDLEKAEDLAALANPGPALAGLRGLVVLDEIQRRPDLFTALRPLADRPGMPARFLLLGSASPELVKGASESLAGRTSFVPVPGFSLEEVGASAIEALWLRGGFPRAFLAETDEASLRWRQAFITAFLERDLPQLGIRVPSQAIHRFWMMLAHAHGQVLNAERLAASLGVTGKTIRHHLDLLVGTFMVRRLQPWHENLGKRQVKAPKIYLRDPGLLHALLGLGDARALRSHPVCGASWEGFAIEELLKRFGPDDAYFWATHAGAEIDLLLLRDGRRFGFEIKLTDAPSTSRSMHVALADLGLERLFVIHGGTRRFPLGDRIEAVPAAQITTLDLTG